jgi:hypothetical protein
MVRSKRTALESTKPKFWEGMDCEKTRNDSRASALVVWSLARCTMKKWFVRC